MKRRLLKSRMKRAYENLSFYVDIKAELMNRIIKMKITIKSEWKKKANKNYTINLIVQNTHTQDSRSLFVGQKEIIVRNASIADFLSPFTIPIHVCFIDVSLVVRSIDLCANLGKCFLICLAWMLLHIVQLLLFSRQREKRGNKIR